VVFFGRDEQVDQLLERLGLERFVAVVGASGCGKSSLIHAGLIPALGTGLLGSAGARWAVATMRPGDRPLWRLAEALLDPAVLGPGWSDLEHPAGQLHAMLLRGPLGLAEVLDEAPLTGGRKLLLLVDQFEELFRYRREGEGQRDEANAFVALLLATVREADRPVYIILTMRSDYLGDCALFDGLPEALNDSQFLTPKLTRAQRQQAIEGPARVFDGRVEPALVTRILNDMGADPDQLPLMQHALMRLWKGSHGAGVLSLAAYDALGGLHGALSGQADAVYASLDDEQQRITEVLFRRLSARTTSGRDIRLPTRLDEIARVAEVSPQAALAVVDVFRDPDRSFLTPPWPQAIGPDDILDISHESLIRHWGRLRAWVADEAASADVYRRLEQTARLWSEGRAGLWGPPDLDQALRWKEQARPNTAWSARYGGDFDRAIGFLDQSIADRDRKQAEERKRQDERVEQNRRLAKAERQRAEVAEAREREAEAAAAHQKTLNQRLLIAAVILLLLALAAGVQTWRANRASERAGAAANVARESESKAKAARAEAEQSARVAKENAILAEQNEARAKALARIATSRQLAALSVAERDKRFDRSLLLAVEAFQAENTVEARESLFQALQQRLGLTSFLHVDEGTVRSVAFSPDGKTLAAGYSGRSGVGGVVLWDVAAHAQRGDLPLAVTEGPVWRVAFSPDGKILAAGYLGGGVVLWDVAARKRLGYEPLAVREGDVQSVAFSPDGKILAAGYSRFPDVAGVVLWDVAAGQRLGDVPLAVDEGYVSSVAFSTDGKTLAAGYGVGDVERGGVVLWDVAGRKRLVDKPLAVREGDVWSVAFSPDGKILAAGYLGGGVVLWDVAARARLGHEPVAVNDRGLTSVAFSPDGKTLATGYSGVVLWDIAAHKRLVDEPLAVMEGLVWSVAFSPDGKTVAAGYHDFRRRGGVVQWDVAARKRLGDAPLAVTEGPVWSVAFSPDGKTIAAGYHGDPAGVVLWDAAARRRLVDEPLAVREGSVSSVAFSPDGKTLAAGYGTFSGGGVVLWDAAARRRLVDEPLDVPQGDVESVAFSPDGKTLAAGYRGRRGEGGVVLWDVDLESWQRRAGRIANRNFTRKEWRDYFPETPYRKTFPDLPDPPESR
jgi:WD40 repeat protein